MATEYPFTKQTFIGAIRKKAGNAYTELDDDKLFSAVTNKFPKYLEQIDPTSLEPAAPERPGLMGRLFEAAKGMVGGFGVEKPALASPTLAASAAVEPVVPPMDPAELNRLAGTITDTQDNVRKVLIDQTLRARERAMDSGGVAEWLKARKANRKFAGVTRIDPVAALEMGAAKADPAAVVDRNAVGGELTGREVAPSTGLDRFASELKTASSVTLDKNASVLSMPDVRPEGSFSLDKRAQAYAGNRDLLSILSRPILGALGRSVIGKTTGNMANFAQLAANPEKYYSVTGARSDPTPVEVKRKALDSGMLDDPNPVAKFAGQTVPGFVLGGDAALAAVPDIGFPLLAGAHQILDNVARAQKGEQAQWDPHQIGIEAAKGMMFSVLPLPKTLTKAEGGMLERAARQMGQVGYQTAAFTAADIAAERKQPSMDDALGTFALLGALHLPKLSHAIWAGRIEEKLKSGGMDKAEAATYANAAMGGDPQAQAFVDKFADDASFREAFAGQQRLRSEIKAREQSVKSQQADLIARAKAGDRAAFEELLQARVGGEVEPIGKPHVAENRRSEGLLPAKPGEVRLPAGVDADLRRTAALKKLRDITPVEKLPPVKIPGERGEFTDPNDGRLLTYLAGAVPARMVARMPGEMRLRLGNNPEELRALSAEVLAVGKTVSPAPIVAPVVKTPGAPPPVTVTPPKSLPVPAPPPPPVVAPVGNGKPVPVPPVPVGGNAFRVKSPLRRDVVASGRFDVIELDQLFNGPQDRNRTRAASNAQTEQVYQNFDEEELGNSVTSDRGAPIVMADGRILAGHGRRNVLTRVYGVGDAKRDRYRGFVEAQAAALGLSDKAKGLKEPVLVRVADKIENATPEEFAELSNQKQMLGYSDAEKAVKDARRLLSSNMIQSLNVVDPDNLLAAGNRDFIGLFLDKQDDAAEYWTAEGQAAPALEGRIQRAVLSALVLGDAKAGGESNAAHTVAVLVEKAADYGVTPMIKGLTAAAPKLLKIKRESDWNLTGVLARTMPEILRAKEAVLSGRFQTVMDYFRQSDWTRAASEKELEVATLLINAKSSKQVAEMLDDYAKVADHVDDGTQDMFGASLPESTAIDVLRRLNRGQTWNTIASELTDARDAGRDRRGVEGQEPTSVGASPGGTEVRGQADGGGNAGQGGTPQRSDQALEGSRYKDVIATDLDDLNKLFGTGESDARQSDNFGLRPESHGEIPVSVDGGNHDRAAGWNSTLRRVQGVYEGGYGGSGSAPITSANWRKIEVDRQFGSSPAFAEAEKFILEHAPKGTQVIPVKNLWGVGMALPRHGVILIDSSVPVAARTAAHETFHILVKAPESAPMARRVMEAIDVSTPAVKAYVEGRNAWRELNGQPPLAPHVLAEEVAAELFADWETKSGFGGKTYRLNSAIPERSRKEVEQAFEMLHSPRELPSAPEWGEPAENDLFGDLDGLSRIQWELERIAESRGVKPAGWGDYDALATRALQSTARRLADRVKAGEITPEAAKQAWDKAQADIERGRSKIERRKDALRADAAEKAQGKLLDVPSSSGMLFEEGEPYDAKTDSAALVKRQGLVGEEAETRAEGLAKQLDFVSSLAGLPGNDSQALGKAAGPVSRGARVDDTSVLANRQEIASALISLNPQKLRALFDKGIPVSTIIPELIRSKAEIPEWNVRGFIVKTPEDAAALFIGLRSPAFEQFSVLYLDSRNAVIEGRIISIGVLDSTLVHPRDVFGDVPEGTVSVVVGHNHPSEDVTPSAPDIRLTRQLIQAGQLARIPLMDSIITQGHALSMREQGSVEFQNTGYQEWKPRVIPRSEMKGSAAVERPFKDLEGEAPWNVVPRNELMYVRMPSDMRVLADRFKAGSPDHIHVIGLNTHNRVQCIWRLPRTNRLDDVMKIVARQSGRFGVAAAVVDFPENPSQQELSMFQRLPQAFEVIGVKILDVAHWTADGQYKSMRESGEIQFEERKPEYDVVREDRDMPPWWDTVPGIVRRDGSVDFGIRGKTHEESFGMNLWGHRFHYSPKDGKVIWWEKQDSDISNSARDVIENRGWKYVGDTEFLKWHPEQPVEYMASDRFDADPMVKVARVLVGMNDGKVPTRAQAEEFLKARGWMDKLSGRLDEILKKAESIAGTKELDYAVGIKTGKLGSEGEAGRQSVGGPERGDAGSGPALAGTVGGASPRRRTDIRIAGAEGLPRPPNYVPATADADEDQRLGINLILHRFANGGRGFLLADGTGMGKTTQILLAADLFAKQNPGARVLIVTKNAQVIKGSFYSDSKRMGVNVNQFDLTTYDGLKSGVAVRNLRMEKGKVVSNRTEIDKTGRYDLVIFDEAHELKNLSAAKTTTASEYIGKAKHVVFATATPMDRPTGSVYFLSQVTGIAPDRIGDMLGFEWKQVRDPDTGEVKNMIAKKAGLSWADVLKNLANMRNEAVRQGAMIRREYPLMATLSSEEISVSPADLDFDQRIVAYYQGLSAHYPPNSIAAKNFKGQATNASHHFGESLKIGKTIEKAMESIAAGRRPVVVVSKVDTSERLKAPPMMIENAKGQTVPNWKYDVWVKTIGREHTIPAVAKGIVAGLKAKGIVVAEIFGAGDKAAEVARFQNGKAGAVVMTAASGGAGINLDDVVGDAPRDLIVITPIFAGDMFQQVLGRISRRNTASWGRVIFLNASGTYGDSRARAIQKAKIELMMRIQEGGDIDIAGFDKDAGLPVAAGGQEEFGGDEDGGALADMSEPGKRPANRVSGEMAQGEDVGGVAGGVWGPRIPGGMPDPTTGRAVMTLPALVRLYKEMTGNRAPVVKKRLRILGGHALGAFYPGGGKIQLAASIFDPVSDARKSELLKQARAEVQKPNSSEEVNRYRELLEQEYAKPESKEPRQALATLAHEIGHAYDWLPDRSMAKGNILGRIAAFHQYMNDMLGQLPQFQNLITQDERRDFRAEAAKQARAQIPPVPGATEAQRKARDAGVNKLTADIYGRMLAAEAKRRNLVTREQVTDELKALTQWWKPFDEDLDPNFTNYRYSAEELLADAISVMMNRPEALRRIAPVFDKAFFGWMGNRPEFQRVWDEIQSELIGGEADKRLVQDILEGFREAEGRERDNLKARKTGWSEIVTALRFGFIDTADPILRKVREYGERELDAMDNPRYAIEDAIYAGSAHEGYLKSHNSSVLNTLNKAGISTDMFGVYRLAIRVRDERGKIANPFGIDIAAANRILNAMTPENRLAVNKAGDDLWKIRKEYLLDELAQSDFGSDELLEKMIENEAYTTIEVIDYMKARYGSNVGPRIFRQVGTLASIKNPYVATIQKDMSLISAILRNNARRSVVKFLEMAFPREIEPAKTRWNGRFQESIDPEDPHKELLGYLEKGKFKGYYVDKWVAAHFAHEDPHWLRTLGRALGATMKPFRFAFTDANPGFWAMNLFRDYHGAIAHLPGALSPVGSYTWHWAKGVREGFKSVFGTPGKVVQDMLKHKMLISMVSRSQEATDEDTILDRLLVQVQPKKLEWSRLSHPAEMVSAALDWWTGIGKAFERSNQIASYTWLKKHHPTMTDQEIAHLVRTVASPAFLRKGALYPIYNNLLMFSNANKEGLRAEAEAFRRGKAAWAIKTAAYVVMPRLIIMAIKAGLVAAAVAKVREWFSPDDDRAEKMPGEVSLQEMYGLIPEYDLANYLCAPVGMTDGGKVVYLRLPQQENARMIGGIFWKTLQSLGDKELHDVFSDTFSFAGGQVPRANPAFGLLSDIGKLMSGENPVDTFRQQPMIDQTTWEAQDSRTAKAAAKGLWNEAGGGILIRFRSEDSRSIQTILEKALGAPFLGNIASRFVKVSDRGLWEDVAKIKEASKRQGARERLNVAEMVKGERPFDVDAAAHKDYLKKLLIQKGLREARNDSTRADPELIRNFQILKDAGGDEERGKLVEMLNRRGYLKSGKNP